MKIQVSHLKVVDRLERVYAGNLAVLEAKQDRFEVLSSVSSVLTDQEEVGLDGTESIVRMSDEGLRLFT